MALKGYFDYGLPYGSQITHSLQYTQHSRERQLGIWFYWNGWFCTEAYHTPYSNTIMMPKLYIDKGYGNFNMGRYRVIEKSEPSVLGYCGSMRIGYSCISTLTIHSLALRTSFCTRDYRNVRSTRTCALAREILFSNLF